MASEEARVGGLGDRLAVAEERARRRRGAREGETTPGAIADSEPAAPTTVP